MTAIEEQTALRSIRFSASYSQLNYIISAAKASVLLSLMDKSTSTESYRRLKREAEHIANDQLRDLQQQLKGSPE